MGRTTRTALVGLTAVVVGCAALPADAAGTGQSKWPARGQAAYAFGAGRVHTSPNAHVAPIASMAKTMTALLVLRAHPLRPGRNGFTMTVTHRDVRNYHRRVARGESTVPVRYGEKLTERQALAALLLPSANNIAIMLARKVAGQRKAFVVRMNRSAHALHMTHTTYTDPSGFDYHTRSTPRDQLLVARAAMAHRTFRRLVARRTYRIPVAGRIYNTDTLLGSDGFVGIKTGSMDASGGCFMFVSYRRLRGHRAALYGVVMGQRGANLITAGLSAARRLADRIAPHAAG